MRAVVTAGGTREPIDDVRVITNLSTGRFGAACANALARRGVDVVLVASLDLASHPEWVDDAVTLKPFGGFASLDEVLGEALTEPVDMLFMAAAVSDYSPTPTEGKIKSTSETITLTLKRNPKLLATLRERTADHTTLIGFKLLSGVPRRALVDVGREYIRNHDLDFVFANDLHDFRDGQHPGIIVSPSDAHVVMGTKAEVAEQLVTEVMAHVRAASAPAPAGPSWPRVELPGPPLPVRDVVELTEGFVLPTLPGRHGRASIAHALGEAAVRGGYAGGGFSVVTGDGRAVVGLSRIGQSAALRHERLVEAYDASLAAIGESRPLRPVVPILVHDRLVGLAARFGDVVAPWFAPDFRRHGWGDELARGLDQAGLAVAVPPDGPERDWFLERGYVPTGRTVEGCTAIQRLDHPSSQPERRAAASATLIDPVRRRVLVGQRKVGPWPGYWAFPGGSRDEGESLVDTARRELGEETGIEVVGEPVAEREVIVGHSPGYRVTNFTFVVWDEPTPSPSPELEAAWFDWDQARALRPMAAGTRRILREVTDEPHAQIRPPAVFQCLG